MVNDLQIMYGLADTWGKTPNILQVNAFFSFRELPFADIGLLILTESQQNFIC